MIVEEDNIEILRPSKSSDGDLELTETPFPAKSSVVVLKVLPRKAADAYDEDGDMIKPLICEFCKAPVVFCHRCDVQTGHSVCSNAAPTGWTGSTEVICRALYTVELKKSTTLHEVGTELWPGALILADYILYNPSIIYSKSVCDLGAGVGLVSMIAASLSNVKPRSVLCTDGLADAIALADKNVLANNIDYNLLRTAVLDWSDLEKAIEMTREVDVLLAADVLYNSASTASLAKFLRAWFSTSSHGNDHSDRKNNKAMCISLERRYELSENNHFEPIVLQVDDFFGMLREYEIKFRQIDLSVVPIRFKYGRTRDHELWMLTRI